jgi:hypothetical protein
MRMPIEEFLTEIVEAHEELEKEQKELEQIKRRSMRHGKR